MTEDDSDHHVGASFDPDTDTYRAKYHPDEPGSLVGATVYLVSVATGDEPETMTPLYDVVDADALENLFRSPDGESAEIEFQYCGCEVTAVSDGEVVVSPLEDDE